MRSDEAFIFSPFERSVRQVGTSFIELMVGMALLSVVTVLASSYFRQSSLDENESRARSLVDREALLWIHSIERDLSYREFPKNNADFPAICNGLCREFYINPLARQLSDKSLKTYNVQYYTYCQGIPDTIKAKYGEKFNFSANALKSKLGSGHPNRCMAMVNCSKGYYPQMVRTITNTAGLKIPMYPTGAVGYDGVNRTVLPQLAANEKVADQVIAAAACTDQSPNNSDRIMIEMAYLSEDNVVRIRRQELSVPRKNLSRAQVVPNE